MKLNITGNEHKMLLAMAYLYGLSVNADQIEDFTSPLLNGRKTPITTFKSLESKGLLVRDNNFYYRLPVCYTLKEGLFLPLLKELLSDKERATYNAIQKIYKRTYSNRALSNDYLDAVKLLRGGKYKSLTGRVSMTIRLLSEFSTVIDDEDFHDIFIGLSDENFHLCLSERLGKVIVADWEFNWDYVKELVMDRSKRNKLMYGLNISCFNFFYFLATGTSCVDIESLPADMYSLWTVAIMELYKGDYSTAYRLFTKAMTANNKITIDDKGIFPNDIVNYYYSLCLILTNTEASLNKYDAFHHKRMARFNTFTKLLFTPLHEYLRDKIAIEIDTNSLKRLMANNYVQAPAWLIWMLLEKLGSWPDDVERPSLTAHTPLAAWLRCELKPTGVIPESDHSDELFGGTPLTSRLSIKPLWEMRLEEIIEETAKKNSLPTETPGQDARLVYILDYDSIDPLYQKLRKNGTWSVGKHLDSRALKRLTDPWLDSTDNQFIKNLSSWTYMIDMKDHLVDLIGCDHVFADEACTLPVNIHEDKPFLVINKKSNGSFSVAAQPESIVNTAVSTFIYVKNSETDYSIYRPTPFERNVYRQIMKQKVYPSTAEPLLKKLIETVGGRTEIHSNIIVDNESIKKVNAQTKITIRCVPEQNNQYAIGTIVRAYGTLTFVPGEGAVSAIADENGKRVQVVRKLRVERENMRIICAEFADLGIIEDEDDWSPTSVSDSHNIGVAELLPLLDWTKQNSDICEMEWPENARVKYHPVLSAKGVSISFKGKNGWFDVEGEVQIDDRQVISLRHMLELMHASDRSKYIKIGDQEYITLSRELSKILKRLDTVVTDRRNHLQMSTAAVGLIGDILDNGDIHLSRSKAVDEIRKKIEHSAKLQPKVPKTLKADLRDYQVAGFEWMSRTTSWGAGVCLADDMGLGKTVQTIALLLEQQAEGPSLIVAPASVVPNWRNELLKFAPTLNVTILNEAEDRKEAIESANAGDIVVTTYGLLNNQQDDLTAKEWNVVCLDEAHTIKNPNTKMSKAAMKLQAKRKVELTGTPIQNHLSELWNLFQFINPGLLGSAEQFSKKFIMPVEVDHNKERQNQLKKLISPFILRRTKGEVIEELPEKDEIIVPVDLSSDEMTMYEIRRRKTVEAVKSSKTVKVSTLAEITRLRQMACSCSLVDKKWKKTSSKVEAFIDLAESLNDSGNRALVFSQFTSFFAEIRKAMDKAKLPYLYLDGSTPMKQREKLVADFQKGDCPFFLISLKAGGLGLNLTGANYVIHLDPWWNPAIEQQATDRAYRIGQQQNVTVYHLISQHTIEEKILRLHKTKRDLADSLLEGTDMSHALTQEELLELLK